MGDCQNSKFVFRCVMCTDGIQSFETELRLTFSPIFRNDAMVLVESQGTILLTMASISCQNVAA